jgi:outer membrane protein TolC
VIRKAAFLVLLAGCSGLDSEPLDPARSEAEFRSRRLDDPGLLSYLESEGVPRRAAWQLDALTVAAFYYHPDLDIARARLRGARGAETTAGMVPNPTLNGDLEKVLGSSGGGVSPWVYGFNLQMPLDFLWKRGYRVDEARARIAGTRFELGEVAWQVRHRVRAALLEDVLVRKEVELRETELAVRIDLVAVAVRLLASGETSRLEVDRARAELAVARVALDEAKGRAGATRAALGSALGVSSRAFEGIALAWPDLESVPDESQLSLPALQEAGLLNRLDVRRGLADYAAAEAALGLELLKRYPDVTLGPGYLFDQGDKKFTLGLSISLPIFNQNGGPIAEAEAKRKEAAARFLSIQARAIGEFEEALARFQAGRGQLASLRVALAAVTRRLEGIRRAVDLGEADRATLLGAQLERSFVELAGFEALRRSQEALGALEDALQRPLGGAPRAPAIPETVPRQGSPGKEKP